MARSRGLLLACELASIAVCLQVALPLVLALQPTTMELDPLKLEPEFGNLQLSNGEKVTKLFANKGM